VAFGLAGSLVLTRFLQTMLFDVKPTDPDYVHWNLCVAGGSSVGRVLPARRATRVDPLVAPRHE